MRLPRAFSLVLLVASAVQAQPTESVERSTMGDEAGERAPLRLDGVAAVIGSEAPGPGTIVLLRSDVELRARLALLGGSSLARALAPIPPGVLTASLTELVGEALIALEARRLNLEEPSPAARAEERARLIDSLGDDAPELLRRLRVSDREIANWVERRATVSGFLAANLEGTLDVSDMELERLFRSEAHPYRDQTFAEARERFAEWLTRDRMTRAIRRWVDTLAKRTPHRVLDIASQIL